MSMQDLYSEARSFDFGYRDAGRSDPASELSPLVLGLLADAQRTLRTDIEATRAALGRAADLLRAGAWKM